MSDSALYLLSIRPANTLALACKDDDTRVENNTRAIIVKAYNNIADRTS